MNRAATLAFSCLVGASLLGGCKPTPAPQETLAEQSTPAPAPERTPEPTPEPTKADLGRHELGPSAPLAATDLDRLVGLGFNTDEIVSEIQRRGVLKLPEPAERVHVLRLPGGERLLGAMESPANLLSTKAAERYGRRQAGLVDSTPWADNPNLRPHAMVYVQGYVGGAPQQQASEYQSKRAALTSRITMLKQQRKTMQQRGEMVQTIGMEIDRLERELAALVPPQ